MLIRALRHIVMWTFYLALLVTAASVYGQDSPWANSPYAGWADKQQVTEAAKPRMNCASGGMCACCNQAEIIETKFRPTSTPNAQGYPEDGWEWFNPTSREWQEVPSDVIHWDEPTPDGRAVMFLWPPTNGQPRCFFPPSGGVQ
jgi:hypothetical protein